MQRHIEDRWVHTASALAIYRYWGCVAEVSWHTFAVHVLVVLGCGYMYTRKHLCISAVGVEVEQAGAEAVEG